jgi:hypothetical protein
LLSTRLLDLLFIPRVEILTLSVINIGTLFILS